jgi:hypothetical protein
MTPREDLQNSGLSDSTIALMRVASISAEDLHNRGIVAEGGYTIPYFDFQGNPIPDAYRIKLLPAIIGSKGNQVKYLSPKGGSNHAYLPPGIDEDSWLDPGVPLVITEGEKKAAAAAQAGLCCMGLAGVDSWRTRTVRVGAAQLSKKGDEYSIQVRSDETIEVLQEKVIEELRILPLEERQVFICFDSPDSLTNPNVQRAAFELAVWLQDSGADVVQVVLPLAADGSKVGLDDYFLTHTEEDFWQLPTTFPSHPRIKVWLRRTLDDKFLKRSGMVRCARAILNVLDTRGQRYVDPDTGYFYYYDTETSILHEFGWGSQDIKQARLSSFGILLQDVFGVGATDTTLMGRIADLYTSGKKIRSIKPRRVSWCSDDALYYQLSDSFMAKVTAGAIEVLDNGTDGVLFLSGQVEPLPITPFMSLSSTGASKPVEGAPDKHGGGQWMEIFQQVNLQPIADMTMEETRIFLAGLYYLNPWFRRWRGLMLPMELIISEPNSGKTFLCNLRSSIYKGQPSLNNAPSNLRDWYAQISNSGGMWICDNVGDLSREMREQMSDEIARLVTDPAPRVEMRKLFTTSDSAKMAIDPTFVMTAIRNPFWKPDILQRSIVVQMRAIPKGQRDSGWYQRQMANGGRVERVKDHLLTAQAFLRAVSEEWNDRYLSNHRLVHFEQALLCMGKALGSPELMEGAVSKLFGAVQLQIAEYDPILEALRAFADEWRALPRHPGYIRAADIVNWVSSDLDSRYGHLRVLGNPISLGKYISTHAYDIQEVVGLISVEKQNQKVYYLKDKEPQSDDSGKTD